MLVYYMEAKNNLISQRLAIIVLLFQSIPIVMRKYLTELIGTFFLVLAVGMSAGAGNLAPLAIGATLMVMIFAGGHVSGAHYNPAVTVAVLVRGKISPIEAVVYIVVQVAGAALAAMLVAWLLESSAEPIGMADATRGLVAEL